MTATTFDYASKIQSLIANAEDERLPEDTRAMYRQKAEELMIKYRIAEEELLAEDANSSKPISTSFVFASGGSEFAQSYYTMLANVARHTGCRYKQSYEYREQGRYEWDYVITLVGYEGDIRYTEFLWTAIRLMFATRVDVGVNSDLTEQENAYYLRSAGLSRAHAARALWGSDMKDGNAHGRVQKLYLAECQARGEEPLVVGRNTNAKTYREVYAREFTFGIARRLREARDAADSVAGGVELHGRADRVDEAFYEMYPDLRPSDTPYVPSECPACKAAKHASGKCKNHRVKEISKADMARWDRMYNSPAAVAGGAAGKRASDAVQIQRGFNTAQRTEGSSTQALEG